MHYQVAQVSSSIGNGLVAYYKFDESIGTIANDSAMSNTGSLINGPTWTSGKVGSGAIQFDGTNDYVRVGDVGAVDGLQQMTVTYWINPATLKLRAYHVTKANAAAAAFGWAVHATDDTNDIRFQTRDISGAVVDAYTTGSFLSANAWTHVAIVFDGTQSTNSLKAKIYINGSERTANYTGNFPAFLPDTSFNLVVGWEHNTAAGLSFNGLIDDVRIYDRALSSSEISEVYSYTESSSPPPSSPTNQAPTVSAGSNQTITLPANAALSGTANDDGQPSGSILTTTWSMVQGPGTVTFANSNSLNTSATFSTSGTYTLRLTATDSIATTNSDIVITVNPVAVTDNTPPTVPTGLIATAISSSEIKLDWGACTDNVAIAGYVISRDGVDIATTTNLTFSNISLSPDTSYSYTVYAYDTSNNISAKSTIVTEKTRATLQLLNNNNLLDNSSFETPGDNFWGFGGSKISESELSADSVHGMYSLKWPYVNNANDLPFNSPYTGEYQNTLSYQPVIADAGSVYTLSASIKYIVGGGQVEYQIYDSTRGRGGFGSLLAKSPKFTLTNTWNRYDWTFTLPSSASGKYVIRIVFPGDPPWQNPYPTNPRFAGLIDAIKFEKGNLTNYTTNPIEVGMYPESEFNAFQWGADTLVGVYLANNSDQTFSDTVDLTLEDFFGSIVSQKSISFNVPSKQRVRQNTSFGTNLRGHYRIIAKVNGVIKSEKVFSTIPVQKNINPSDSIYGIDSNLNAGSVKLVKKLGLTRIRPHGDLAWGVVEKTKGVFDFPDFRINRTIAMGLQPYGFLSVTPSWAGATSKSMPNSLSDWENYVYRIVDRYKNDIKEWEIYNETFSVDPSNGIQHMTGPEYLSLVQAAKRGASRADPSAKLVGWSGTVSLIPGQNYSYKDVKDQLISQLDILSAHYYATHATLMGTNFYDTLKNHTQVISGGSMRVWNTEGGALGGGTFYKTKADFDPNDDRNGHAADSVRYLANHKAADSPLYYYWLNFPSTGDHSPGYSYTWTLNEYDTSLKATAVAIANSAYFLDGANIKFKGYVAKGDFVDDESIVMMQFIKDTNNSVMVAWTDVPGKTVVIENNSLPAAITIYDMFGKVLGNYSSGQRFSYTLNNNPVYITVNTYDPNLVNKTFFQFGTVASNDSILISEAVNGDKNPMRVRVFGSENPSPGINDLLFAQDVANGSTITYPWDAPIRTSDSNTLMLYHFDKRAEMAETTTSVKDFSSYARNATLVNTVAGTLEYGDSYGKFAGGLKSDGTTNSKSIRIPNDLSLNNLNQFTIEMWLKSPSLNGSSRLFSKGDVSSFSLDFSPYAARIRETGREIIFQVSDGTITRERYSNIKFPADNTYHHLVFVFDGSGFQQELRKMDIYLDGKNVNGNLGGTKDTNCPTPRLTPAPACQIPAFTKSDNNNLFVLGYSGSGASFNGFIDEFVMYKKALTYSEIYNRYKLNSGKTYYWFTEFIGNTTTRTAIKNSAVNYSAPTLPEDPPPTPIVVTGQCSAILNQCVSGAFSDLPDSATQNLWSCVESNGGTNASCSFNIIAADTTPPTISISSPTNDSIIKDSVPILAIATDNIAVQSVQFKLDGVNFGGLFTQPPYSGAWNTVGVTNGNHILTAQATDINGNTAISNPVNVTIANVIVEIDSIPPIINNVAAPSVTAGETTITFQTNEPTYAQIEYGLTDSYGNSTSFSQTLVNSHSISISGLNPNTLYHYRVITKDASGNVSVSTDNTFTTRILITVDTDLDGVMDSSDMCQNTSASLRSVVNKYGCPKPKVDNFDIKPNFDQDLSYYPDFIIGKSTLGKINFRQPTKLYNDDSSIINQLDIDSNLVFSQNKVSLNSKNLPQLNKRAIITMYNVNVIKPKILKDGTPCTTCSIISFINKTLVFNVDGFSVYEVIEGGANYVPNIAPNIVYTPIKAGLGTIVPTVKQVNIKVTPVKNTSTNNPTGVSTKNIKSTNPTPDKMTDYIFNDDSEYFNFDPLSYNDVFVQYIKGILNKIAEFIKQIPVRILSGVKQII